MAVFSNEVIEARFINEGNTTIEVLYNIGKEIHSYVLEHDEDSEDFKDLVKDGWNIEKILNIITVVALVVVVVVEVVVVVIIT